MWSQTTLYHCHLPAGSPAPCAEHTLESESRKFGTFPAEFEARKSAVRSIDFCLMPMSKVQITLLTQQLAP